MPDAEIDVKGLETDEQRRWFFANLAEVNARDGDALNKVVDAKAAGLRVSRIDKMDHLSGAHHSEYTFSRGEGSVTHSIQTHSSHGPLQGSPLNHTQSYGQAVSRFEEQQGVELTNLPKVKPIGVSHGSGDYFRLGQVRDVYHSSKEFESEDEFMPEAQHDTKDQVHGDPAATDAHVIPGCIDQTAIRYEAAGMNPVTALARAEQDCVESPSTTEETVAAPDNKALSETSAKPVAKKSWREKVDSRLKELGILPDKPVLDTQVSFKVSGNHWLAVWSNNFKDRDGEIFPQKAIDAYVNRVDMGIVRKPELWVWHIPGTRIGQADWVGRHEHFLIAGGTFDENAAAQTAKAYYSKHADKTADSHGFQFPAEKFDGKHYHDFNSFEVTLLPVGVEANSFTSLEGVKEMALTDQKKKYLVDVFGKEHAEQILVNLEARGKALEDLGVEYKDFAGTELVATDAKALEASFKELIPDLVEGSAEAVTSSLEAVRLAKAMKTRIEAQDAAIAEMRQALAMRPRASVAEDTIVDPDKHKDAKAAFDAQGKKFDEFWQVPVKK